MFIKADFFARRGRIGLMASGITLAAALLGACTLVQAPSSAKPSTPEKPALPASAASSSNAAAAAATASNAVPSAPSAGTAPASDNAAVTRVLAYADRIRSLSSAELNQEVARLGNAYIPANQLQLALALAQLRQTPELIRAQELLTRLLANTDAEAQALHPLARLLAARYGEQRRLEDQLDKQNQQTREVQRRLDQTNERLEALKAIERSLTSRSPSPASPAASAPASRNRTPAPAP
ncbi:hypothetical protein [Polaromonas naphthalenivorans]|uniref:Lipoprotein n=1 Tax=Polaromonas naphthalenivorans (strain CJ2) TaxID=365044 RepID=A1VSP4_POLNA|nr:hypothetical protein [Polaromonas naphthalenivorans]ABM38672.1 conserved hypothetical protein [Polaromonas naphthalenivorans CJ2]